MKILEVKTLVFPEIKVIRYQRFGDKRGYFTETYRKSDLATNPETHFLNGLEFTQINESFSRKGVIKGMHFQWNPNMAKLVRPVKGTMIDLFLDIRKNSPTYGKGAAYELSVQEDDSWSEWIWIPVGFAHGLYFEEDTTLEYLCTGQWAPQTERSISPLAADIDWSLMDANLSERFKTIVNSGPNITEKDKNGLTMDEWTRSADSNNFIFSDNSNQR